MHSLSHSHQPLDDTTEATGALELDVDIDDCGDHAIDFITGDSC